MRPKSANPRIFLNFQLIFQDIPVFLQSGNRSYLKNPGPGTYENIEGITNNGHYK